MNNNNYRLTTSYQYPFGTPNTTNLYFHPHTYRLSPSTFLPIYLTALSTAQQLIVTDLRDHSTFLRTDIVDMLEFLAMFRGNPRLWIQQFATLKQMLETRLEKAKGVYSNALNSAYLLCVKYEGGPLAFPYLEGRCMTGDVSTVNPHLGYVRDLARYMETQVTALGAAVTELLTAENELVQRNKALVAKNKNWARKQIDLFREKLEILQTDFRQVAGLRIEQLVERELGQGSDRLERVPGDRIEERTESLSEPMSASTLDSEKLSPEIDNVFAVYLSELADLAYRKNNIEQVISICLGLNQVTLTKAKKLLPQHDMGLLVEIPFTRDQAELVFTKVKYDLSNVANSLAATKSTLTAAKTKLLKETMKDQGKAAMAEVLDPFEARVENCFTELAQIPTEEQLEEVKDQVNQAKILRKDLKNREKEYYNLATALDLVSNGRSFESLLRRAQRIEPHPPKKAQKRVVALIAKVTETANRIKARKLEIDADLEKRMQELREARGKRESKLNMYRAVVEAKQRAVEARMVRELAKMEIMTKAHDRCEAINKSIDATWEVLEATKSKVEDIQSERRNCTPEELKAQLIQALNARASVLTRELAAAKGRTIKLEIRLATLKSQTSSASAVVQTHVTRATELKAVLVYAKTVDLFRTSLGAVYSLKASESNLLAQTNWGKLVAVQQLKMAALKMKVEGGLLKAHRIALEAMVERVVRVWENKQQSLVCDGSIEGDTAGVDEELENMDRAALRRVLEAVQRYGNWGGLAEPTH